MEIDFLARGFEDKDIGYDREYPVKAAAGIGFRGKQGTREESGKFPTRRFCC
jgi:hypothetical protein